MNLHRLGLVFVGGFLLALSFSGARGSCPAGELSCDNGDCIKSELWCNEEEDCIDGSDEVYCKRKQWSWKGINPNPNNCGESLFLCGDGRCVPSDAKCNGHSDCKDGTDEDKCDDSRSKENSSSEEEEKISSEEENFPSTEATTEPYSSEEKTSEVPTTTGEDENYEDERTTVTTTTAAATIATSDYYQKKAVQSTQKTYAPDVPRGLQYVPSAPPSTRYATPPISRDRYSGPPTTQRTLHYPQPTADPRRTQRPPYSYNQPTPSPRRPPSAYTQLPPYHYTQQTPHRRTYSQGSLPTQHTPYPHRPPPPYSQRPPNSHNQATPYNNRHPYREPHNPSPHSRYPEEYPRTQHEVQQWPDPRLAPPPPYTGRRRVHASFHFPKNYTHIYDRENGRSVRRGVEWLVGLRDASGGWGANTSRALVALALANNDFVEGSHENDLMKKYLKVHLGVKLLSPQKIGANQLAGHVNALLATCQDPRDFHGTDVVSLLKEKVRNDNPFVLLSLCLAEVDLSTHQVYSLMRTLSGRLPHTEREKDLLSLSVSAFSCHVQRYVASHHADSTYLQTLRSALRNATSTLLQLQLEDGSFGSVYSTALATQALLSVNDSLSWDPKPTFAFLLSHQQEDGSFGDFLATYLALPALSGRGLLHLTNIRCHEQPPPVDLTPLEIVTFRGPKQHIRYSLQFGHPLSNAYSVELVVPHGITFFDVMRVAEFQNKHFNFLYEEDETRIHVYSISDVPNDVERGLKWQLYVRRNSESGLPRRNEAYNGDIRELVATADQHYVFWFRPENL